MGGRVEELVVDGGGEEAVSLSAEEIYRQQPPGDWIGN